MFVINIPYSINIIQKSSKKKGSVYRNIFIHTDFICKNISCEVKYMNNEIVEVSVNVHE